jgi:xylulokinase
VQVSDTVEASCLGAAMVAATAAGWYPDVTAAAGAMAGRLRERRLSDPATHARYQALRELHAGLYPALQRTYAGLAAFREEFRT